MSLSKFGLQISGVFHRIVPDPFVIAIVLTVLTFVLALTVGQFDLEPDETGFTALLDAWRVDGGLWKFLGFGMQMCLILVTGHALAMTSPVRKAVDSLAGIPGSTAGAAFLVAMVACITGLLNWGLGLIVGAFMAREVGRSLHRRNIRAHYPLLCAAGYMGLLVWHGGFSGSAPLSMTTKEGAAKVLPDRFLESIGEGIPLTETILSPQNMFISGGLLLGIPILCLFLAPKRAANMRGIETFEVTLEEAEETPPPPRTVPDRMDRSALLAWLLAIPLLIAFLRYGYVVGDAPARDDFFARAAATLRGFRLLGLNEINTLMIALGLLLHASPRSYMNAIADGARGCAGIIIQFPLYAGIMAMMVEAGLIERIAVWFNAIGTSETIPVLSFLSAAVVNIFIPSGGGQWGIQGPIALQTGLDAGIEPGRMVMAVAYGDQLTNMLQPFWALPLLAITGARARDIVGYTAIIMIAAGIWMTIGLLVF